MATDDPMRLQKFLARAGVCSRRAGERLILEGRVTVNGHKADQLGIKVHADRDSIAVDGRPVTLTADHVYVLVNKPAGIITSCRHRDQKVVTDLVDLPARLFPVGRLDKDSTGLVLLTDDGRIHHRLLHPSFDHEKEYVVSVARPISDAALAQMRQGVALKDGRTRPARLRRLAADRFRIVLQEGRNRQIRRMVAQLGNQVLSLHRVRMAHLRLGRLPAGKWRHLTAAERNALLKMNRRRPDKVPMPQIPEPQKEKSTKPWSPMKA